MADGRDPMIGLLRASARVRNGMWIKGAPSHVLADLLTELEGDGWRLIHETHLEPPGREVSPWNRVQAVALTLDWIAGELEANRKLPDPPSGYLRRSAMHLRTARVDSQTREALDAEARAGGTG